MKKLIALLTLIASTAFGATLTPVQLLNPTGSTAGQVLISNGPSSAPSWSANFGPLNFASTGYFYQGQGGNVSRINDRLFVGGATANNGTQVASQPDWLTQFQISTGRGGGFMQLSSFAVLNGIGNENLNTVVIGAQTLNGTMTGLNAIGMLSVGVSNNTTYASNAYANYSEAYRMSGVAGGAYGFEIDTVNYAGDVTTDPYQQNGAQTIALQLAAGAELSPTGQYPSQAAINIQNNNSTFDKGIIFGSTSLTGDTGTSGSAVAIGLGFGHTLQWYYSGSIPTSLITSTGTTAAGGIQQKFSDNSVSFNNASNANIFQAFGVANGVNGIQALGASTGNAVQLQAIGSDTNIPIQLNGKGTAGAQIQGFTDGSSAAAGALGETQSGNSSSVSLTSGATSNCASKTLTAGDWLIWGTTQFSPAATTNVAALYAGISATSGSLPATSRLTNLTASFATGQQQVVSTPPVIQNVSASTTYYLVGNASFGTSTMTCSGTITALRYH